MRIKLNYMFALVFLCATINLYGQNASINGNVMSDGKTIKSADVELVGTDFKTQSDVNGQFTLNNIPPGKYKIKVVNVSYEPFNKTIRLKDGETLELNVELAELDSEIALDDVVITGTMKPVTKDRSPVPVEVYSSTYFKKNPTPNMFDALQTVNGVRPQVNCNVCNTGDIHINGLEGPYTMVLIDGMPIVSSLGTVYGLSGIPNSMIERIEVVKGPASSLYGSEAIGGLINVITKKPNNSDQLSVDVMGTTWEEYNADLGFKFNLGKDVDVLTGINYYNYQKKHDKNNDNFTDVTLQNRITAFQKWNINRPSNRLFSLATRYLYEDRWGGDLRWEKKYRGGDEIYGESIYTNRAELFGTYQLPLDEKMFFTFSYIYHDQDSRYGSDSYIADQQIAFGQLTWDKKVGIHDLLTGVALRYTHYDDNTPGTADKNGVNDPEKTWLPGIFIQDEMSLADNHHLLLGFRYDHNNYHGNIFTPRLAYKWNIDQDHILRLNAGTGFRVVNLFTEDHAALTGAREVVIVNDLNPEKSYNANINFTKKVRLNAGGLLNFDASAFYTYFDNKIEGDFESDITKIIYDNIDGHAVSQGVSLNTHLSLPSGFSFMVGGTFLDNTITNNGETERPEFNEKFTGTWAASYKINSIDLAIDYTGNVYGPMKLPTLNEYDDTGKQTKIDPRDPESPWWSIQNIQLTYTGLKNFEIYGGVKNLLDWTPADDLPFLISRTNDPFDKTLDKNDPHDLPFSPEYVYAPNQGIRGFLGIRYIIR